MNLHHAIAENIDWIRHKAKTYCKDEIQAEDLASETIIKCLYNAGRFDTGKQLKPWIQTIMANTFKTDYNRRKCISFVNYDLTDSFRCPHTADERTLLKDLIDAIGRLEKRSLCIQSVLLYIDGYNYSEIARKSGIPIGTVKSRIATGRKILRESLAVFAKR